MVCYFIQYITAVYVLSNMLINILSTKFVFFSETILVGYVTGFELAIHNLQFAKRFGSLRMSFSIFSENCELLKSDTL